MHKSSSDDGSGGELKLCMTLIYMHHIVEA